MVVLALGEFLERKAPTSCVKPTAISMESLSVGHSKTRKEEDENLECNDLMCEGLVDQMGKKGGCGMSNDLIMKKM